MTFDREGRRRAVFINLDETKVVTDDDFPTPDEVSSSGFRDNLRSRWNDS